MFPAKKLYKTTLISYNDIDPLLIFYLSLTNDVSLHVTQKYAYDTDRNILI